MTGLVNLTLVGDAALVRRLREMPETVAARVTAAVNAALLKLQGHIVADKLSGQVLNVKTGNLRRSITVEEAAQDGAAIVGRVYSAGDVKYAGIHEFGYKGPEQVAAFTRKSTHVFGRTVPQYEQHVGAFTRNMNVPERSFMRSGLADLRAEITADIDAAAKQGAREAVKG